MMRRLGLIAAALLLSLPAFAADFATISDPDLLQKTRDAVVVQDADAALDMLTEMQRRGTGVFAGATGAVCEEVIDLPATITDWKFRAVARQAYFRVAMSHRIDAQSCACLFDGFDFATFVQSALGKPASEMTDRDRPALERIRDRDRRETEAQFRSLEQSCRVK